jgi:SAM-dependent methyltransferase
MAQREGEHGERTLSVTERSPHASDDAQTRRKKALQRKMAHVVCGSGGWVRREMRRFAADVREARVLELGSGRQDLGRDAYSMRWAFGESNEFVQSDIVPEYGHELVDVTTMEFEDEFDVILCLNVLEHVYDFQNAIGRIHAALKPGGRVAIVVPVFYPYHDEPNDYWRFTEHALRRMFETFAAFELRHRGLRQAPFAYFAVATK